MLVPLIQSGTLSARLSHMHLQLLETTPDVDRVACALYDGQPDSLRTFVSNTRNGEVLSHHERPLINSKALHALVGSGSSSVLDELDAAIRSDVRHSAWLTEQGYQSSFTVPLCDEREPLGFVFFDSVRQTAFTPALQRDLVHCTARIGAMISAELAAVRTILESAHLVRQLTEMRDFETGLHLERIGHYARLVARNMAAKYALSDQYIEQLALYAPLHDIGKIGIPDHILLKPGQFEPEEREIMNTHVDKGVEIIDRILQHRGSARFPDADMLRNIVHCHHELLDGSGYPRGLTGASIPLEARIVTVADIFDALTGPRPYRTPWTAERAMAEINSLACEGKLDPDCAAALEAGLDEARQILASCPD